MVLKKSSFKPFDPERHKNEVIEYFRECPRIMTLFHRNMKQGDSEIYCTTERGDRRQFFVPCGQLGAIGQFGGIRSDAQFVYVMVSHEKGLVPKFWLIIDMFTRQGYLLPLDVVSDAGVEAVAQATETA